MWARYNALMRQAYALLDSAMATAAVNPAAAEPLWSALVTVREELKRLYVEITTAESTAKLQH